MDREKLERDLAALPLYQYAFLDTAEIPFSENVRHICETECPMYNTTWACPPAVGTVAECKARCLRWPHALLLVTVAEVEDAADMEQTLPTRQAHEYITRQAADLVETASGHGVYVLSTESCAICAHCAWPDAPCRHPDRMCPCVESHGILVTALAERCGIDFLYSSSVVLWFSLIFYSDQAETAAGLPETAQRKE